MSIYSCSDLISHPTPSTDPNEFLLFTQRHASVTSSDVRRTDVRLISLDAPPFFVDTLTSVTVPETSARFIAYDAVTLLVSIVCRWWVQQIQWCVLAV